MQLLLTVENFHFREEEKGYLEPVLDRLEAKMDSVYEQLISVDINTDDYENGLGVGSYATQSFSLEMGLDGLLALVLTLRIC